MDIISILALVVLIILIYMVFKVTTKILKIVSLVFIGIIVISFVLGFFIVRDAKDFRENFPVEEKKILLLNEDEIITAFSTKVDDVNITSQDELDELNSLYKLEKYDDMLDDSYKMMIFNFSVVEDSKADEFEFDGMTITKEQIIAILLSDNPMHDYIEDIKRDDPEDYMINSDKDRELKAKLFAVVFTEGIMDSKLFFYSQYQKDKIYIYPETIMFKAIRLMPLSLIQDKLDEVKTSIKESIKEKITDKINETFSKKEVDLNGTA